MANEFAHRIVRSYVVVAFAILILAALLFVGRLALGLKGTSGKLAIQVSSEKYLYWEANVLQMPRFLAGSYNYTLAKSSRHKLENGREETDWYINSGQTISIEMRGANEPRSVRYKGDIGLGVVRDEPESI